MLLTEKTIGKTFCNRITMEGKRNYD